jgi:geranylgeranylglycerol-phosphate geranylgeranyltransferase
MKIWKLAKAVLIASHPFPATINAIAGAIFYMFAVEGVLEYKVLIIFASIFSIHAAIGISNDCHDIDLDQHTKPDKPLVRGDLGIRAAQLAAGTAAVIGLLLSGLLGWATLFVALAVLVAGLVYNVWAKGTIGSWLPYAVAIPALPVWSYLAAGKFRPIVMLTFPLGILISLALNLANTLPDLSGDSQYGIRGLAHRLGLRLSLLVIWLAFGTTILTLFVTPHVVGNNAGRLGLGLLVGSLLFMLMIIDHTMNRSNASLRRGWYYSALLALILGGSWVASL